MKQQSAGIARSQNRLKFCTESENRGKILLKICRSIGLFTPSIMLLSITCLYSHHFYQFFFYLGVSWWITYQPGSASPAGHFVAGRLVHLWNRNFCSSIVMFPIKLQMSRPVIKCSWSIVGPFRSMGKPQGFTIIIWWHTYFFFHFHGFWWCPSLSSGVCFSVVRSSVPLPHCCQTFGETQMCWLELV